MFVYLKVVLLITPCLKSSSSLSHSSPSIHHGSIQNNIAS
ncbi:hypothetical protein HMPREF1348_02478 [Enterococcus faecium 505]|uniref:Uncharacterized protein n=1 Tax=Enterococcus faecium 505 TaxID=1134806 RepID=J6JT72_ENTFC|nr:hypothetical protein HMPREF1348_02478 [Enterococcus faecium 505]